MKIKEFLNEFEDEHFPRKQGPLLRFDMHEPPFTKTELKAMEKARLIEIEGDGYRLTMRASELRGAT